MWAASAAWATLRGPGLLLGYTAKQISHRGPNTKQISHRNLKAQTPDMGEPVNGSGSGSGSGSVVNQHRPVSLIVGSLIIQIVGIAIFFGGAVVCVFRTFEETDMLDAFYAAVVTITTVGYGDKTPKFEKSEFQTFILIGVRYFVFHLTLGEILDDVCDLVCHLNWVETHKRTIGYVLSIVSPIIFISGGAAVIKILEDKSWYNSFYHSMSSIGTVGYGDEVFSTRKGKFFAIIWLLLGVPICEKCVVNLHQSTEGLRAQLAFLIGNRVWAVANGVWTALLLVGNEVLIVLNAVGTACWAVAKEVWTALTLVGNGV